MARTSQVVIRVVAAIFLLIALALVAAGTGLCVPKIGCTSISLSIDQWNSTVGGQYYVFVISIFLLIEMIVFAVLASIGVIRSEMPIMIASIVAALLCLVNAGVEAYYAAGKFSPGYDASWAAATAFYFICTGLYAADAALSATSK